MNNISTEELEDFIIGKKLGYGVTRTVYDFDPDNTCVIKVAHSYDGRQTNITEYKIWDELSNWNKKLAKWFAPCISISEGGKYLVQKKIEFGRLKDYPKKVPHFFYDIKKDNYGWYGNKFVCCDYGYNNITDHMTDRMKNVNWN